MPTGYTYPVAEGKITDFPTFALSCARAFGALINMRDDPEDKPIPNEIEPDTSYHDQRLVEDKQRLAEVQAMTEQEAKEAAQVSYSEALKSRADYLARKEVEAALLNKMLAKVRAWKPPTADHVEMKKFMIDQLEVSLPSQYVPPIPIMNDGKTWQQNQIDGLTASITRNERERAEEIERAASRTAWLKSLRKSLAEY